MPYLLLNGTTTENLTTYLRDVLFLNFKTLPSDIPFNDQIGLERFLLEEALIDYVDKVRDEVSQLLNKLNKRHNSSLTLSSITTKGNSELVISINLEHIEIEDFVIPILSL